MFEKERSIYEGVKFLIILLYSWLSLEFASSSFCSRKSSSEGCNPPSSSNVRCSGDIWPSSGEGGMGDGSDSVGSGGWAHGVIASDVQVVCAAEGSMVGVWLPIERQDGAVGLWHESCKMTFFIII